MKSPLVGERFNMKTDIAPQSIIPENASERTGTVDGSVVYQ
jgi:hypothetical protein